MNEQVKATEHETNASVASEADRLASMTRASAVHAKAAELVAVLEGSAE